LLANGAYLQRSIQGVKSGIFDSMLVMKLIKSASHGSSVTAMCLLTFFMITDIVGQKQLISGEASVLMNEPQKTKPVYESEAYQFAVNNAIDKAFGSSVLSNYEQTTYTEMSGRSVAAHLDVRNNYLNTYPNGIWLEDKSVRYSENKDANGNWWMNCFVTGYAKEIESARVTFIAKTLDGADHKKNQTETFFSGEQGYLYFKSAMDGYLVCFYDDMHTVQRCIPFSKSNEQQLVVENNREYLFFSAKHANYGIHPEYIDEIEFYTEQALEYNQFYILFSPTPLGAYLINDASLLDFGYSSFKNMSREDFHRWLQENRIRNPEMQVQIIGVTIRK
jgi:hypothetical protein